MEIAFGFGLFVFLNRIFFFVAIRYYNAFCRKPRISCYSHTPQHQMILQTGQTNAFISKQISNQIQINVGMIGYDLSNQVPS